MSEIRISLSYDEAAALGFFLQMKAPEVSEAFNDKYGRKAAVDVAAACWKFAEACGEVEEPPDPERKLRIAAKLAEIDQMRAPQ